MIKKVDKNALRKARHQRIRNKVRGTAERPRMCIYRSLNNIYVQVIDDAAGKTLVAASTMEKDIKAKLEKTNNVEAAKALGEIIAKRALDKGIETVVFDRGGYIYHGKVAALAEAAREAGLQF